VAQPFWAFVRNADHTPEARAGTSDASAFSVTLTWRQSQVPVCASTGSNPDKRLSETFMENSMNARRARRRQFEFA